MNISIYDLEWSIYKKKRQIIQIGYIIYNIKKDKIIKKGNLLIKPYLNNFINPRIEKLTSITNNIIQKKGINLKQALDIFLNEAKKCKLNISNGNDYNILKENYSFLNHDIKKLNLNFFNCRYFFSKAAKKNYKKINSSELNKIFKINVKKNIIPHNAADDCYLILKSLKYNSFFKKKYYIFK